MPPNPAYFLAAKQLSTILSKTFADFSLVFGELAAATQDDYAIELAQRRRGLAEGLGERVAQIAQQMQTTAPAAPPPAAVEPVAEAQTAAEEPMVAERTQAAPPPVQLTLTTETPAAPEVDLVPIETAALRTQTSPASIYGLINKGLITREYPLGNRPYVRVSQVVAAREAGHLRRPKQLREGDLTPLQAAAMMDVSPQVFYGLITDGKFTGARKEGRKIIVPAQAVQEFLAARGLAPKPAEVAAAAAPKSEEAQAEAAAEEAAAQKAAAAVPEVQAPTREELLFKAISDLENEIKELEPYLDNVNAHQRVNVAGIWAGGIRKAIADASDLASDSIRAEIRRRGWAVLTELREIAQKYEIWANALIPDWDIEDWDLYIRSFSTPSQPRSKEEEEVLVIGDLRAMLLRPRAVPLEQARAILEIAKGILPADHKVLARANKLFDQLSTRKPIIELVEAPPEPPPSYVTPEVLALTQGKRVVILGGQGERDENVERLIEQLQLASCEWITHEKGKAAGLMRIVSRFKPANYDLLICLVRFSGHSLMDVRAVARRNGLPVVMCSKGYGVASIVTAIVEQYSGTAPAPPVPARVRTQTKVAKRPPERRARA